MKSPINLITFSYDEKNQARKKELADCATRNAELVKTYTVPENGHRTTYQDLFDFANERTGENDINIIANSDIYVDKTIELAQKIGRGECWALTRYNRGVIEEHGTGSQDVWIFRGKIKIRDCFIPMGIPGCDNRVAYEIEKAGYQIFNPSLEVKTHHVHKGVKSYNEKTQRVEPPYKMVPPIKLPKRIFHVSLGTHQQAQIKALKSLGSYDYIDWTIKQSGEGIVEAVKKHDPEIVFMQIQREGIVTPEMVREMKANGAKVFNWTGDVRKPLPNWFKEVGRECLTLFTNMEDIDEMRREGLEADYLQIGYDETVYHPLGEKIACPDIVFMGNNYGAMFPLSQDRQKMVNILKKRYGRRFGLYGNGWRGLEDGTFNNDEQMEAKILRSCKIAINFSHFCYRRYSSDRLFRILGSGAFCLSHYYPEMDKEFKNNVHLQVFHDMNDLVSKIDKYLNDKSRGSIALNGWKHCKNTATWAHRIQELNKWL